MITNVELNTLFTYGQIVEILPLDLEAISFYFGLWLSKTWFGQKASFKPNEAKYKGDKSVFDIQHWFETPNLTIPDLMKYSRPEIIFFCISLSLDLALGITDVLKKKEVKFYKSS